MLKKYIIIATMEIIITIVITALSVSAHAKAWSNFTGYNESKQLITLNPDGSDGSGWYSDRNEESPQDKNVEDLYSVVYVGTSKSPYKYEIRDICHRYHDNGNWNEDKKEIWCDGNKESPLHGVRYKYVTTNKLCDEIWQCVSGCNSRAPKKMFYLWESEQECSEHKEINGKTREDIFVRDRPDINGRIIGKYSGNTRVKIIGRDDTCRTYCFKKDGAADGQWIKVKNLSDKSAVSGWIFDYFVEYSETP